MFTDETGYAVMTTALWIAFAITVALGVIDGIASAYQMDTSTLSIISGGIAGGVSAGFSFCLGGLIKSKIVSRNVSRAQISGVLGRTGGSIVYNFMYEYMMHGEIRDEFWGAFIVDVGMDTAFAAITYGYTGNMGDISGSVVNGFIDGSIDVLQTELYFSPEASIYSIGGHHYMNNPAQNFSVMRLYIVR